MRAGQGRCRRLGLQIAITMGPVCTSQKAGGTFLIRQKTLKAGWLTAALPLMYLHAAHPSSLAACLR